MFHLTLTPIRMEGLLAVAVTGDTLILNGEALDFAALPEGALLPREAVDCPWLASDVTRTGGAIHLTLLLPHGAIPWPAPPEAQAVTHPDPIITGADGPVDLPSYTAPMEDAA